MPTKYIIHVFVLGVFLTSRTKLINCFGIQNRLLLIELWQTESLILALHNDVCVMFLYFGQCKINLVKSTHGLVLVKFTDIFVNAIRRARIKKVVHFGYRTTHPVITRRLYWQLSNKCGLETSILTKIPILLSSRQLRSWHIEDETARISLKISVSYIISVSSVTKLYVQSCLQYVQLGLPGVHF